MATDLLMVAVLRVLGLGLVVFRILELGDTFVAAVIASLLFWMVGAMADTVREVFAGFEMKLGILSLEV
jgi:hypothetical protein